MGGNRVDAFAGSIAYIGWRLGDFFWETLVESAGSVSAGRRGWADSSGKYSLSLLGGGRADFSGKRSQESAGFAGERPSGFFRQAFVESAGFIGGGDRADFSGKCSLGLLGLLTSGRADFPSKYSLRWVCWDINILIWPYRSN